MLYTTLQAYPTPKSMTFKQLLIICLGNVVAYFDFLIYFYLADIISLTFFPVTDNSLLMNLQTLSLFTAGYLSRPIGALLIGRFGDLHGRKPALFISLCFMSFTTLITACLPTYAQIGILAPVLFFIARIVQGMAFGAHAPLGWVFITEHVNKQNMAIYCSLVTASFLSAGLIASIFFDVLHSSYTQFELINFGWRLPFIIGGIFSLIALMLWHLLEETPVFLAYKINQSHIPKSLEMTSAFRRFNAIFIASLVSFAMASIVVVVALILPDLIAAKFSIDKSMLSFSNDIGLIFLIIGCAYFGLIADRNGVGKSLMVGSIAFIMQILALYYHLASGNGSYLLVMYAILGFCSGIIGLGSLILVQLFPTEVRLTAVSLIYNFIYAIVGGFLPLGLAYATNTISFSPALYLTFIGIIAFMIGLYFYRSPTFKDLDASLKS